MTDGPPPPDPPATRGGLEVVGVEGVETAGVKVGIDDDDEAIDGAIATEKKAWNKAQQENDEKNSLGACILCVPPAVSAPLAAAAAAVGVAGAAAAVGVAMGDAFINSVPSGAAAVGTEGRVPVWIVSTPEKMRG